MGWIIDDCLDSGTIVGIFHSKAGVFFVMNESLTMLGACIFSFQKKVGPCLLNLDIG